MKKAGVIAVSAAPGLAVAYLLLAGYLVHRVKPMPITFMPRPARISLHRLPHRLPS